MSVFEDHLAVCRQCREDPFDLCAEGQLRLREAVDAVDVVGADETWNTCPDCFRRWKDRTPTPGVGHRTRRCITCVELTEGLKF